MTEKTEQLNKRRAEALASLVGDLDAMADAQPNTQRPEHLLELYIQKLNERELISANEGPKDEFTKTPLGSETASADAFGISFSGEGEEESAQVNVFVVDPRISPAVENLNVEQVKAFFRKAQNFIQSLKDGTLERRVPDSNPSKKAAHAVYEAVKAEAVKEWRIWLVTTSVWRTVGDKAMAIPRDLMPDAAMEVLDLDFYRLDEDAGISQKFEEPGLPCIAFEVSESQDYSCYLTVISGVILADLYHKHGTALVEENVRAYLGNNKVNKQVKETIKNNPERFLAYNNGLVVSAGGVSFGDEKHARIRFIEQMQIINGGQTTVSIYQSLYNTTRSRKPEVRRKLKDLFIPMKVVVPSPKLEDEEKRALRDQISRAANSQSAVKTSDLAANGPFQIKFAQIVQGLQTPDRKYWFYERARGLYKADLSKKKYSEKRIWEEEHPADKVIDKTELSTAWLAWNGYPVECAKGKEIAFNFFREAFIDAKTGLPKSEHDKMNEDFAKKMICQCFIMRELEKSVKGSAVARELRIQNPRVPAIYAIYIFSIKFGTYVDWDAAWNDQQTPPEMLLLLQEMTRRVDALIREDMGSNMISMWGRKLACRDSLLRRFSFDEIRFNPSMRGLKLPDGFQL